MGPLFSGEDLMSHKWLKEIKQGESVKGLYVVKEKGLSTTKKGEPFLALTLADRSGEVEARVWEGARDASALFSTGDVVEVEGEVTSFRDKVQININRIKKVEGEADPSIFVESSPEDPSSMITSLAELLRSIREPHLITLVNLFLKDHRFIEKFKKAPAAKNFHHNYVGGLLEHTLGVCRLAEAVARLYPRLDRDLLLAGGFVHDIGKVKELSCSLVIDYTDEGRLLGHLTLGVMMLREKLQVLKSFPRDTAMRLEHMILSHHGEFEFGSPKRPKFLEALILHFIDDMDAKINAVARFMDKDARDGIWTEFHRAFERFFLKGVITEDTPTQEEGPKGETRQPTLFST